MLQTIHSYSVCWHVSYWLYHFSIFKFGVFFTPLLISIIHSMGLPDLREVNTGKKFRRKAKYGFCTLHTVTLPWKLVLVPGLSVYPVANIVTTGMLGTMHSCFKTISQAHAQPNLTSRLISNPLSESCFSGEEVGIKFPHLLFPPHLFPWEFIPQCARAAAHSRNPDVVHSFGIVRFLPDAHWPKLAPQRCKARATAMVPPAAGKKPCLQLLSKYQTITDSVTSLKWQHWTSPPGHFPD